MARQPHDERETKARGAEGSHDEPACQEAKLDEFAVLEALTKLDAEIRADAKHLGNTPGAGLIALLRGQAL